MVAHPPIRLAVSAACAGVVLASLASIPAKAAPLPTRLTVPADAKVVAARFGDWIVFCNTATAQPRRDQDKTSSSEDEAQHCEVSRPIVETVRQSPDLRGPLPIRYVEKPCPAKAPSTEVALDASQAATEVSDRRPPQSPPRAPRTPTAAPVREGVSVQLGAVSSRALADRVWADAAGLEPNLALGKAKRVESLRRGDATLYRVLMTGFSRRAEAEAFCNSIQDSGRPCFVRAAVRELDGAPVLKPSAKSRS